MEMGCRGADPYRTIIDTWVNKRLPPGGGSRRRRVEESAARGNAFSPYCYTFFFLLGGSLSRHGASSLTEGAF